MKEIRNVLVGVATLSVRQPNDAIAEWSDEHAQAGTHSAKLHKGGSGNDGSTNIEIIPPAGETMTTWAAGCAANQYTFWYYYLALLANWVQVEFHFEDQTAGSEGWADITCVPHQGHLGTAAWLQYDLASNPSVGFGGWGVNGIGQNFFNWGLGDTITTVIGTITVLAGCATAGAWELTRVRFELWEATPERSAWIDSVVLNALPYTIEPGGTAPGMSLSSPFTEVGYTEDGVIVTYTADEADIEVEEETFPIDRVITKETAEITCNMAESSLRNISNAMAGSILSGSILTLGGGVNKKMNLKIEGISPDGFRTEIFVPKATATGSVGMSYRKGVKTVVPITLQALKPSGSPAVTIVYNAA